MTQPPILARALRRNRTALAAASAVLLAGACSLSGVGGGATATCRATQGTPCQAMSTTYALGHHEAVRDAGAAATPSAGRDHDQDRDREASDAQARAAALPLYQTAALHPRTVSAEPGAALRSGPTVLRGWFKSWEDSDGDLFGETYVWMAADNGRWLVEHNPHRTPSPTVALKPPVNAGKIAGSAGPAGAAGAGAPLPLPPQASSLQSAVAQPASSTTSGDASQEPR